MREAVIKYTSGMLQSSEERIWADDYEKREMQHQHVDNRFRKTFSAS